MAVITCPLPLLQNSSVLAGEVGQTGDGGGPKAPLKLQCQSSEDVPSSQSEMTPPQNMENGPCYYFYQGTVPAIRSLCVNHGRGAEDGNSAVGLFQLPQLLPIVSPQSSE